MKNLYVVTGANGFLGTAVVKELLANNKSVLALIHQHNLWSSNFSHPKLKFQFIDVTDFKTLDKVFSTIRADQITVIHCAGIVSIANKVEPQVHKVNVGGAKNIIKISKKYKIRQLIYISSVHALTELPIGQCMTETNTFDPSQVEGGYAKTKAEATILMIKARKDLNVTIVHPSGIIGPGDYGNNNLKQMILDYLNRKLTATVKGGYDFVDVRDVAKGIVQASLKPQALNQNYIFSNQYYQIKQIIELINQIKPQHKHHLNVLPYWFIMPMARLAELYYQILGKPPIFTSYSVKVLRSNGCFDHSKATEELNYQPRPLKETLQDTIDWYEQNGWFK